nr:S41 family peptidase [Desulfobulbaceae bacterium]
MQANALKNISILTILTITLLFQPTSAFTKDQNTYKNLETFANVLSLLEKNYVEEIDSENVINGAIKGMLSALDPHSSYLKPESFKDLQIETKGSFSGIGIEITMKNDVLIVVSPIEGTPAYEKGIKAGDKIIKIGKEFTKEMTLMEAVTLLRGKKGSEVTISIHRKGWDDLQEFTITRDVIPLHSVKASLLEPGYGYVRITNFQAKTTRDTREAINRLSAQKQLAGLVLDLRNNPGGLLEQSVNISDLFLNEGMIVYTKGRLKNQNTEYFAHSGGSKFDFPLIVLVNEGSASASEIVAGALQDHKRALILGVQTFGKGSVQTVFPLNDGAGLRLTTARYYTPNGTSIQAKGITPDLIVPLQPPSEDKELSASVLREKDLKHHIKNGNELGEKQQKTDEESELNSSGDVEEQLSRDNQLSTALMLLKGLNVFGKKTIQDN